MEVRKFEYQFVTIFPLETITYTVRTNISKLGKHSLWVYRQCSCPLSGYKFERLKSAKEYWSSL